MNRECTAEFPFMRYKPFFAREEKKTNNSTKVSQKIAKEKVLSY